MFFHNDWSYCRIARRTRSEYLFDIRIIMLLSILLTCVNLLWSTTCNRAFRGPLATVYDHFVGGKTWNWTSNSMHVTLDWLSCKYALFSLAYMFIPQKELKQSPPEHHRLYCYRLFENFYLFKLVYLNVITSRHRISNDGALLVKRSWTSTSSYNNNSFFKDWSFWLNAVGISIHEC